MADFVPLTDAEALAFDRFERMRDWALRFRLLRLGARAQVRVATAVATGLTPSTRTRARLLAALSRRTARAYDRLAALEGAVRDCTGQAERVAAIAKVAVFR